MNTDIKLEDLTKVNKGDKITSVVANGRIISIVDEVEEK